MRKSKPKNPEVLFTIDPPGHPRPDRQRVENMRALFLRAVNEVEPEVLRSLVRDSVDIPSWADKWGVADCPWVLEAAKDTRRFYHEDGRHLVTLEWQDVTSAWWESEESRPMIGRAKYRNREAFEKLARAVIHKARWVDLVDAPDRYPDRSRIATEARRVLMACQQLAREIDLPFPPRE